MKNEKLKLNLNDLKVDSFITSLKNEDAQTVKGGSSGICVGLSISFVAGAAMSIGSMVMAAIVVKDNCNEDDK